LTGKCFPLTEKCFPLTTFPNGKQTQESLESDFPETTFRETFPGNKHGLRSLLHLM
jgi:hypothetical protein